MGEKASTWARVGDEILYRPPLDASSIIRNQKPLDPRLMHGHTHPSARPAGRSVHWCIGIGTVLSSQAWAGARVLALTHTGYGHSNPRGRVRSLQRRTGKHPTEQKLLSPLVTTSDDGRMVFSFKSIDQTSLLAYLTCTQAVTFCFGSERGPGSSSWMCRALRGRLFRWCPAW